jgi:phytoene/squalene synthetase
VFVALADTVRRFDLPITPFQQLLTGFRIDLDHRRYATAVEIRDYAALAAAPVAHLLLYLGGYREPALHRYAEQLAIGLAFASFWQDMAADLERDRVYVPMDDLRHFEVREDDLFARRPTPAIDQLVRYECARTRAVFERARPVVDHIGNDMAIEFALAWLGGMRILDKIEARGGEVLINKPRLTAADKARIVTRALAWRGGALAARGDSLRQWLHQR